jgi:hypothetical protein
LFQGKRLITRGIADTIPSEVQMFLWSLLDELVAKMPEEVDYLQVFEFSSENGKQTIIHRQENPPYQAVYQFDKVGNPLQHKIYVIDDVEDCTMLLSNEY